VINYNHVIERLVFPIESGVSMYLIKQYMPRGQFNKLLVCNHLTQTIFNEVKTQCGLILSFQSADKSINQLN